MIIHDKARIPMLILLVVAFSGACDSGLAQGLAPAQPAEDRLQELQGQCSRFRQFRVRLDQAGRADAAAVAEQCLKACEAAPVPADALAADVFALYRAWLMEASGKRSEAIAAYAAVAGSPAVAPEALHSLARILEPADWQAAEDEDYEARNACETLLSAVAPTAQMDLSFANTRLAIGDGDPYRTPLLHEMPLAQVAEKLAAMGMHAQAAHAFREAIYAADFDRFNRYSDRYEEDEYRERNRAPWESDGVPAAWLAAAREEWLSGSIDRAADCVAKAIIFGGEREAHKGIELIARIRQEPNPKPQPPKPDPEWLKQMAWIYTQMNMHPKALAILSEHRGLLAESGKVLEQNYADAWLEYLEHRGEGHGCLVTILPPLTQLYGQPAATREERLKLAIPPPCSPAALAKAKQQVREIVRNLKPPAAGQ